MSHGRRESSRSYNLERGGDMFTRTIASKPLIVLAFVGMTSVVAIAPATAAAFTRISNNPGKEFRDIASDGSTVFVQDGGTVYSLPASGGSATYLYSAPAGSPSTNIFGVTVIAGNVFWGSFPVGPGVSNLRSYDGSGARASFAEATLIPWR